MKSLALVLALICICAGARADDAIERGRYLAIVGDCAACHTVPGGVPLAGGRPLETPFGTLVAPNLTSDIETGLGAWSDEDFYRALHDGIGRGGRHLYPGFPYPFFTRATRDDVLAIRAWLATVPPVRNDVHANQLAFPFDIRAAMLAWNELYFRPGGFVPDPAKSAAWNRGAYLVEGLGHCGACHTPRTVLGAEETARRLQGGPVLGWYAPALTNASPDGLGAWSSDDIVAYLRSGANAHGLSSGPMGEVVALSTSHMTEADLRAIATFLKDQPPTAGSAMPLAADDARMQRGATLYRDNCAACHTSTGAGIAHLFPQLAGAPVVQQSGAQTLVHVVLHGARAVATARAPTGPAMPGFWWKFDDRQVADVLTFVRNAWGNAASAVTETEVGKARGLPP